MEILILKIQWKLRLSVTLSAFKVFPFLYQTVDSFLELKGFFPERILGLWKDVSQNFFSCLVWQTKLLSLSEMFILRANVNMHQTNSGKSPTFTPTFIFCSPICPDNWGDQHKWIFTLYEDFFCDELTILQYVAFVVTNRCFSGSVGVKSGLLLQRFLVFWQESKAWCSGNKNS